ncbi:hypothetical protein MHBO_002836 [Bonamia ostreae]|uniref:Trafficking protein particle complex subunit n=1 Tax=Bonamia ostreae TaxID=126728 RepID=A0ABV2ANP1_9EUKA
MDKIYYIKIFEKEKCVFTKKSDSFKSKKPQSHFDDLLYGVITSLKIFSNRVSYSRNKFNSIRLISAENYCVGILESLTGLLFVIAFKHSLPEVIAYNILDQIYTSFVIKLKVNPLASEAKSVFTESVDEIINKF